MAIYKVTTYFHKVKHTNSQRFYYKRVGKTISTPALEKT